MKSGEKFIMGKTLSTFKFKPHPNKIQKRKRKTTNTKFS